MSTVEIARQCGLGFVSLLALVFGWLILLGPILQFVGALQYRDATKRTMKVARECAVEAERARRVYAPIWLAQQRIAIAQDAEKRRRFALRRGIVRVEVTHWF